MSSLTDPVSTVEISGNRFVKNSAFETEIGGVWAVLSIP